LSYTDGLQFLLLDSVGDLIALLDSSSEQQDVKAKVNKRFIEN
jgi:hypothetical protein